MSSVELLDVRDGVATARMDDDAPVAIKLGVLRDAALQGGVAGHVYRWLASEYVRCSRLQDQGKPWRSPRREISEIMDDPGGRDAYAEEARQRDRLPRSRQPVVDEPSIEEVRRRERLAESLRVAAEQRETDAADPWWPIPSWEVPAGVRLDTPGQNQGQIVEVSYGTFGRAEACDLDPYMAITDHGDYGHCRMYKRRNVVDQ